MRKIKCFTLQPQQAQLSINFTPHESKVSINKTSNDIHSTLSYEFIRVLSPLDGFSSQTKNSQTKKIISHKKQIQLTAIESVAQHGYRFIFDDQHSAIYSVEYLEMLCRKEQDLWQQYLTELKKSGHTREATISITQL